MPLIFDKLGITFQYPDNWQLDEEDALRGASGVTVYSPGGAFWSVVIHPRSADPAILANAALDAMKQQYADVEAESIQETLSGREMVGYDLNFYCFDFTSSAVVRSLRTEQATYTIFYQAEDRDFDQIQGVFRAMTASLIAGLRARADEPH